MEINAEVIYSISLKSDPNLFMGALMPKDLSGHKGIAAGVYDKDYEGVANEWVNRAQWLFVDSGKTMQGYRQYELINGAYGMQLCWDNRNRYPVEVIYEKATTQSEVLWILVPIDEYNGEYKIAISPFSAGPFLATDGNNYLTTVAEKDAAVWKIGESVVTRTPHNLSYWEGHSDDPMQMVSELATTLVGELAGTVFPGGDTLSGAMLELTGLMGGEETEMTVLFNSIVEEFEDMIVRSKVESWLDEIDVNLRSADQSLARYRAPRTPEDHAYAVDLINAIDDYHEVTIRASNEDYQVDTLAFYLLAGNKLIATYEELIKVREFTNGDYVNEVENLRDCLTELIRDAKEAYRKALQRRHRRFKDTKSSSGAYANVYRTDCWDEERKHEIFTYQIEPSEQLPRYYNWEDLSTIENAWKLNLDGDNGKHVYKMINLGVGNCKATVTSWELVLEEVEQRLAESVS